MNKENIDGDLISLVEKLLAERPEKSLPSDDYGCSFEFSVKKDYDYETPIGIINLFGLRCFVILKSSISNESVSILLTDGLGHSSMINESGKIKLLDGNRWVDITCWWLSEDDISVTKYDRDVSHLEIIICADGELVDNNKLKALHLG